jgi:hypothetical protein
LPKALPTDPRNIARRKPMLLTTTEPEHNSRATSRQSATGWGEEI